MGHTSSKSRIPSQSYGHNPISRPSLLSSDLRRTRSADPPHKITYDPQELPAYEDVVSSPSDSKGGYLAPPEEGYRTKSDNNPFRLGHGRSKSVGDRSANASSASVSVVASHAVAASSAALRTYSRQPGQSLEDYRNYLHQPMRQESLDTALDILKGYNTVIIVDDSGSMIGSRWKEAQTALRKLAEIASRYDADGIDIYFLNSEKEGKDMKSAASVERLFQSVEPKGRTPIGMRLDEILRDYLNLLERTANAPRSQRPKPVNYVILTDGVPTDDPETVIKQAARRLDAGNYYVSQVGIQFVQIGHDASATSYLNRLDTDLVGVRDMVDTTPYLGGELTDSMLLKILVGGINRRVDETHERGRPRRSYR